MKSAFWLVLLFCGAVVLESCIGSVNSKDTAGSRKTRINLAKFSSLSTSYSIFFNFTGSDTVGSKYTGTSQSFVDGPTIFENRSTIKKTNTLTLTKVGTNSVLSPYFYGYTAPTTTYTVSFISTFYYNLDKTIYKVVYSNGITAATTTATSANQFSYPSTLTFQNLTSGIALNYSNGNNLSSTWDVTASGGSNKQFQVTWTTNSSLSQIDTYIFDPSEIITSFSSVILDFPTPGITTTLTSY